VEVQALDKVGNVLRKSKTPTLYGYMQSYSLLMNVEGASRLRFIVGDGGNGIGDDMTVIGAPTFSMTMGSSEGYLSEFPLLNSSVGSGTVGIDKTSAGGAFSYQSGSHALAFQKGIGLSLKTKSYEDYLANPTSTETYSYAQFNVTSAKAEALEGTLIAQTGSGTETLQIRQQHSGNRLAGFHPIVRNPLRFEFKQAVYCNKFIGVRFAQFGKKFLRIGRSLIFLHINFHIDFAETFQRLFIDGIAVTVADFPIFGGNSGTNFQFFYKNLRVEKELKRIKFHHKKHKQR
jgi:hypothetical protein